MNHGDWQSDLNERDPRIVMLRILELAREAGVEHEPFVRNALDQVDAFSYDWRIVQEAAREVKGRLYSILARQELSKASAVPSASLFKGEFEFGSIVGGSGMFRLGKRDYSEIICLAGRMGSGKSNVVKRQLLLFRRHNVRFLIWDFKDEYKDLLSHETFRDLIVIDGDELNLHIFDAPYRDQYRWIALVLNLLKEAGYTLLPVHKRLVLKRVQALIEEKGHITVFDLVRDIESIVENKFLSLRERERFEIPLENLRSVIDHMNLSEDGNIPLQRLLERDVVIRMDRLDPEAHTLLSSLVMCWTYYFKKYTSDRTFRVTVFEECKHLLSKEKENPRLLPRMRVVFSETRFVNLGLIMTDQFTSLLATFATNVFAFVSFNLISKGEVDFAAEYLGLEGESKQKIRNLQVGQALVKVPTHPYPFKISIEKAPDFAAIDEARLKELMRSIVGELRVSKESEVQTEVGNGNRVAEPDTAEEKPGVLKDWKNLLQAITENPELGISELYERLGFSARKGTKLKQQLLDEGMIVAEVVHKGERARPRKRLQVTKKGEEILNSFGIFIDG